MNQFHDSMLEMNVRIELLMLETTQGMGEMLPQLTIASILKPLGNMNSNSFKTSNEER